MNPVPGRRHLRLAGIPPGLLRSATGRRRLGGRLAVQIACSFLHFLGSNVQLLQLCSLIQDGLSLEGLSI